MAKLEIHFHTDESSPCGKVPAAQGIAMFREAGYDGVMVTDHFSRSVLGGCDSGKEWEEIKEHFLTGYRKAKEAGDALGVRVYLGLEIRFPENDNDYLVFGADEGFFDRHPWVYETDIRRFRTIADEEELCVIQAHPFRGGCSPAPAQYLDGAEYFNGHPGHDSHNALAQQWIEEVRKHGGADGGQRKFVGTAGSDFHADWHFTGTAICMDHLPEDEKELKRMIAAEEFTLYLPETAKDEKQED